jgi:XapX domain-containing protein
MKLLVGIVLGALIGIGCRLFSMPVPGPNAILGALLGIAMASGYELTDKALSRRSGVASSDSSAQTMNAKGSPEPPP